MPEGILSGLPTPGPLRAGLSWELMLLHFELSYSRKERLDFDFDGKSLSSQLTWAGSGGQLCDSHWRK